jgi:ribosome-associated protein
MNNEKLLSEVTFTYTRSGGPGGQHANKVSSKAVILFDLENSQAITEMERIRLFEKLSGKLNKKNQMSLTCDESRSQHRNKQIVTDRLLSILENTLKKSKKRVPTKVSKWERARRMEAKKKHGIRKSLRQKPKFD